MSLPVLSSFTSRMFDIFGLDLRIVFFSGTTRKPEKRSGRAEFLNVPLDMLGVEDTYWPNSSRLDLEVRRK